MNEMSDLNRKYNISLNLTQYNEIFGRWLNI